jgi:multicomponent Na+:H+ antiporter subunit D
MSGATAIVAAVLLPLFAAPIIALLSQRPNLRETATIATALATFATVCTLVPEVMAGARPSVYLIEVFPGLALVFQVEPLGMLFALVASGLWIVTSIYSIGYMRGHHEEHQTRFFFFFAVAISAALATAFSGNMLTLFFSYEVLTLSTYPLVTHHRSAEAKAGGRIYLGILLSTSIGFLLLGMIATYHIAGTLYFVPGGILTGKAGKWTIGILLLLYTFGIGKAALMPFHRWLPAAMVAPTPVSALLHAVAVVKAGVFTIMKVVVYIFGIDLLAETGLGTYLMYVAGATILIGSLVAMTKDNLKARLAYSTISQLSYIVLGAAMANSWGVLGGSMHIVMHAFGKITLFFCAGAIMVALHKTEISDMKGIGRQMPFTMGAFLLASLSIIGLPPLGGAWSKWYLVLAGLDAGQYFAVGVLLLSSLLNIAYLLPISVNAFFAPLPEGEASTGIKEAPLACVLPLLFTALGGLVLFLYPDPLLDLCRQIGG